MPSLSRRAIAAVVITLAATTTAFTNGAAASSEHGGATSFGSGHHIHVVAVKRYDARDYNIAVRTPALARTVNVRILLPTGYADHPSQRYPVLYLFHGTSGRASDWIDDGHAAATTAGLPLIVVMPDAGFSGDGGGWFTDWVDSHTTLGPSQWETFDIKQLVPWVEGNLRTIATRDGRAIAGLSQGGFGAMTYAARHPDMFVSAASFSGAPDIDYNPVVAAGATAVIEATATGLDGVTPDAMFGSRVTDEINWQGHDPTDLATNLRGMSLWLWTASGIPGPYDEGLPVGAMTIEQLTHDSTLTFYNRAAKLGVASHLDDYVFGTHTFPYWSRDLKQYVPQLMKVFRHPPVPRHAVSYMSIDDHWTQWGWSVAVERKAAQEFSSLTGATRHGFALAGTGTARVVTPVAYPADAPIEVTMAGAGWHDRQRVRAAESGALHLVVPLGAKQSATTTVKLHPVTSG